jgi:hypothetical protein
MSTTLVSGHANLIPPSETYRIATLSLVYRLSELTFGSLLAAYSLGFVGAIAAHWAELSAHGHWGLILLSVQYASISITFVYLTTSFYLMYHAGILTMPQMPLYRLREDFTLAVVQAIFFGFSMLRPWAFTILLGLNFILTIHRQNKECEKLTEFLHDKICDPRGHINRDNFRVGLKRLLSQDKDFSELSGWRRIGWWIWAWAILTFVTGLVVAYLVLEFPPGWPLRDKWAVNADWNFKESLITAEVVIVAAVTTGYGWGVLKKRAEFLMTPIKKADDEEAASDGVASSLDKSRKQKECLMIDKQFYSLLRKLEKLCAG